jgi:site-specific DNA-methyltransferase (adenine-specific)
MISIVENRDCMEAMAEFPDKFFDLAVVDPPYGIEINISMGRRKGDKKSNYHKFAGNDKEIPTAEYFDQLFRVSKNQIIWGGNYMIEHLYASSCWVIWDKLNGASDFADCEMAWTSFDTAVRKFAYRWAGMLQGNMANKENRIHPTQKPVALYDWIYKNYLPQGGKVLDTHLGSGSNRIAAHKAGNIDFWGYELDEDYYLAQEKRFDNYIKQTNLFNTDEVITEQLWKY